MIEIDSISTGHAHGRRAVRSRGGHQQIAIIPYIGERNVQYGVTQTVLRQWSINTEMLKRVT